MHVAHVAGSALSGAVYGALTPILALLLLPPDEYGLFSVLYLIYAFGISLQYSVISEAWARMRVASGRAGTWTEYCTALLWLALLVGAAGLVVARMLPALSASGWLLAAAVMFAVYRSGVRYHTMAVDKIRRVMVSDLGGIAAFVAAVLCTVHTTRLLMVSVSWLAAALVGSLSLQVPKVARRSGLIPWIRAHGSAIRPLISDSILMDAGSIGTPFLLVGYLGIEKFGIYRAVANVAMPVRLLVDPMRPLLGRTEPVRLFGRRFTSLIALMALVLTGGCYVALVVVIPWLGIHLGTLTSLVPYAAPCSLYVTGSLLGTVYYIPCRTNASRRHIMVGRVSQTVLVIALPILGFIVANLSGAIWGFAVSSVVSAATWIVLAYLSRRVPVSGARSRTRPPSRR